MATKPTRKKSQVSQPLLQREVLRQRLRDASSILNRPPLLLADAADVLHPRIFISYRRQDSRAAADYLYDSLARCLGDERIFLDRSTIRPGQDFPKAIQDAIRGATLFLVLIGPRWLEAKDSKGHRRLEHPRDYVRREIETALQHNITIIPLLLDGAGVPPKGKLPASIRPFIYQQAHVLPWNQGVEKIAKVFLVAEEQRAQREAAEQAERAKLDLAGDATAAATSRSQTTRASFDVVTGVMQRSLLRQGFKVALDPNDIEAVMLKFTGRPLAEGFIFADLIYVIDFLGLKALKSRRRYVARSFPVSGLNGVPAQLALGRPVLAGVKVFNSWWDKSVARTGIIDVKKDAALSGSIVSAIVGWNPAEQTPRLLTPWPTFGKNGLVWLTRAAAEQCIESSQLRSIEATLKPVPYTQKKEE